MPDTRVKFALDNFIVEDYFLETKKLYHLKEERDSGKSDLTLEIANDNLCIYDFDSKRKCSFLRPEKKYGMQKSVDHVILVPLLGRAARDPNKDEWKKDRIILNVNEELVIPHKKIHMKRNPSTGVLEGELTL